MPAAWTRSAIAFNAIALRSGRPEAKTAVLHAAYGGSSPSPTTTCRYRLMIRIRGSQPHDWGLIPHTGTIYDGV